MKEWKEYRLGEMIQCNPQVKLEKGKSYNLIDIDSIEIGSRYVKGKELTEYDGQSGCHFQNSDTVMARITPCLENGKIAQVQCESQKGFGSTELFVFRGTENKTDSDYVFNLMSMQFIRNLAANSMTGASGRQRADLGFIKRIKWNFPPLPTQQKIASILSAYDNLIQNYKKQIEALQTAASELYKEWFVRFRFPGWQNAEFENGIPEGWKYLKLSEFGYEVESGNRPAGGIDDSLEDGIPSLGAESIDKLGYFDYSNVKLVPREFYDKMKRGHGKDNDILLYKDGAYIGKVTLFRNGFPFKEYAVNEHVFLLRSNNKDYQNYLYFTLNMPQYFTQMQNLNRNAAQPGLARGDLDRIKILVPNEKVIEKFNKLINPMIDNIFSYSKQITNLTQQRDLLLPRLMSGKLEVK